MHARSATVLAGPPALNPRSLHLPPLLPPSPSFFVYLAKFDSPTRSDLTSPIASYPSRLSSLSCSPSCHRGFLCWYLASSLSSSASIAYRLLYSASRFYRITIVVGFFSRHPVLPHRSLTPLESTRWIRGSLFSGRRTTKNFFLPSFATVHRFVMRLSFRHWSTISSTKLESRIPQTRYRSLILKLCHKNSYPKFIKRRLIKN